MTSVYSRIVITAVCVTSLVNASQKDTQVSAKNLFANTRGDVVTHGREGFRVNGQRVSDADLSKDLRGVSAGALKNLFAKNKALRVSRIGNDYALSSQDRLRGGGPVAGAIAYWLTKTLCYGSMAGAAVGAVTVTAGAVLPASAGGIVGGALGGAVGNAIGGVSTVAGSISGGLVSGAVASNAALASGAAIATGELAATTTAVGGVVVAVESASTVVGGFFTALPFLP